MNVSADSSVHNTSVVFSMVEVSVTRSGVAFQVHTRGTFVDQLLSIQI